jgi:hypothetical protein
MLVVVRNRQSVVLSPTSGPVAQLGARFHGMEEVVGSIPTRSTIFNHLRQQLISVVPVVVPLVESLHGELCAYRARVPEYIRPWWLPA